MTVILHTCIFVLLGLSNKIKNGALARALITPILEQFSYKIKL
jgi:hypothetical protein